MMEALLEIDELAVHYPGESKPIRAVDGVSLTIRAGETVALVGESGCGKSTVARAVLGLVPKTSGSVKYRGAELGLLGDPRRRPLLRKIQMIFQDPDASLNPRSTIAATIGEPIEIADRRLSRREVEERVVKLMDDVGLARAFARRYPHELSGGQRQRVCIARAVAAEPELIVCDEAVSALDVSVQAQILNLLADLRNEKGLAYLFITHDLRVVRHLSTRVAVMYLGQIVEIGATDELFESPAHPYTRALLSAVPSLTREPRIAAARARGDVPSPTNPPSGCHFHTRCPEAFEPCAKEKPPLFSIRKRGDGDAVAGPAGDARRTRCFLADGKSGHDAGRSAL
jgi:oligopeptide/dipeptide ABC transporter ATP-binding protein